MGASVIIAAASLAVAAGSAYENYQAQSDARKDRKRANAVSQAQNEINNQAEIRNQIRKRRIRIAQIEQASANTGTIGSSGQIGGESALSTQTGSNISTIRSNINSGKAILGYENDAASDMTRAATWQGIGSLASTSFNLFSSTPQFQKEMEGLFYESPEQKKVDNGP